MGRRERKTGRLGEERDAGLVEREVEGRKKVWGRKVLSEKAAFLCVEWGRVYRARKKQ